MRPLSLLSLPLRPDFSQSQHCSAPPSSIPAPPSAQKAIEHETRKLGKRDFCELCWQDQVLWLLEEGLKWRKEGAGDGGYAMSQLGTVTCHTHGPLQRVPPWHPEAVQRVADWHNLGILDFLRDLHELITSGFKHPYSFPLFSSCVCLGRERSDHDHIFSFFFKFFGGATRHVGSLFLDQGWNLHPCIGSMES